MSITRDEVMEYLKSHPEIFEEQAEFFHQVEIAHPYSGRTISLAERQRAEAAPTLRFIKRIIFILSVVGDGLTLRTRDGFRRILQVAADQLGRDRIDRARPLARQ